MNSELKPFDLAVIAVTAVASQDELFELLVLKGGNALQLVHKLGARASIDLDFSMEDDLDAPRLGDLLRTALVERFGSVGYYVYDYNFGPRPSDQAPGARWGGYQATYKLIHRDVMKVAEDGELRRLRKKGYPQIITIPEAQRLDVFRRYSGRVQKIDISKHEFCEGKGLAELGGYQCYVYTPAMIAIEKLRAICQQMKEYPQRKNPASRARDFYDIHAIITFARVDVTQHTHLLEGMFHAKDVPLELLRLMANYREFHRTSWDAVKNAVVGEELQSFDYYFDFVLLQVEKLQALRPV